MAGNAFQGIIYKILPILTAYKKDHVVDKARLLSSTWLVC
jgi:hypothetical protein